MKIVLATCLALIGCAGMAPACESAIATAVADTSTCGSAVLAAIEAGVGAITAAELAAIEAKEGVTCGGNIIRDGIAIAHSCKVSAKAIAKAKATVRK